MRICTVMTSDDGTILKAKLLNGRQKFTVKPKPAGYKAFEDFINTLAKNSRPARDKLDIGRASYHHPSNAVSKQ